MNHTRIAILIAATFMMGANAMAAAADKRPKIDLGKREYQNSCAVCHGADGKSGGPLLDVLKKSPTDLTALSKKNNGVFPFDRVYGMIDGRDVVKGHGDRDMPGWGDRYGADVVNRLTMGLSVRADTNSPMAR